MWFVWLIVTWFCLLKLQVFQTIVAKTFCPIFICVNPATFDFSASHLLILSVSHHIVSLDWFIQCLIYSLFRCVSYQRTSPRCSSPCRFISGPFRERISSTSYKLGTPRARSCSSPWNQVLKEHLCLRPACWCGRPRPKLQTHTLSSLLWLTTVTLRPEPPYRLSLAYCSFVCHVVCQF